MPAGAALDKSHAVLGLVPTGVRVVVTQLITETLRCAAEVRGLC